MAAFVKSVERVTASFTNTSGSNTQTIALTKGQDPTNCAPISTILRFTSSGQDQRANNCVSVDIYDDAGTATVDVNRTITSSGGRADVEICVVEFTDSVTVQKGTATLTGTIETATISSITLDNAFAIVTAEALSTSNGDDFNDYFIKAKFNSSTEIEFTRVASGPPDWDIIWYVVEGNGIDFQTEYIEIDVPSSDTGPTNVTLSNSVNLDNSFIICSYESSEGSDDLRDASFGLALTGANTFTYYRDHGSIAGAAASMGIWVVRSDSNGCEVQRFATDVDGQLVTDQPITTVNLDSSAIVVGQTAGQGVWPVSNSTNGANTYHYQSTITLTSATNVEIERFSQTTISGNNSFIRYEVVDFELPPTGPFPQTIPVGLVEETDAVFSVGVVTDQTVSVGLVTETDTVFAVTPEIGGEAQIIPVGLISETDSVLDVTPLAGEVTLPVGLVSETDSVFAVTPELGAAPQTIPVGLITEVDSVQDVTTLPGEVTLPVGTVTETDEVFSVTPVPGAVAVSVGIVSELDQVAPVFPVTEGGPQTVLVMNVAEVDTVFPVTPRVGPEEEEIKGGIPPIRKRKRRRYILPDNRVFTDPERALYELNALLKAERVAQESGGEASTLETTPASLGEESPPPDTASEEPVTPQMLATAVSELPELLLARRERAPSLDPQLISVLFQIIDDEEAAMLLL